MTTPTPNASQTPRVDFTNQLLIAMPGMVGGSLADTVIYICEHSDQGALGVVINRPTDLTLGDLLQRIDLDLSLEIDVRQNAPVFFGGPVQTDRGFVLHTPVGDYSSSISMGSEVALTTSRDVLQEVAIGSGPDQLLVTLGYAGWSAGQLEEEMAGGAWLHVEANLDILFSIPAAERYQAALGQLGIDPIMLTGASGHA
ncbi:YqgE/AlgH family protein [Paenalcaligenes hominis]|uniref:YqgE/AlgH family protein n=1 Tax=Paenalcaligenes hominis TaxID=643674 RepID=UPI003523E072